MSNSTFKSFTLLSLFLCLFSLAQASHFRYTTLTWKNTNDPYTFVVDLKVAFRYSYFTENTGYFGGTPSIGWKFTNYDLVLEYPGSWSGTATTTYSNVQFTVDNIDYLADWLTATSSMSVTFSTTKTGLGRVTYVGTNRIKNLNNNADKSWNVTATMPIGTNTFTTSPVAGLLPIVPSYMGQVNSIPVLSSHNEISNSKLTYSLSGWSGMTHPPGLTIDANTGVISYTPTATGFWCTQVIVTENSGYKGSTSVDFLINVTAKAVTPNLPPYFVIPPTPEKSSYVDFTANVAKAFQLQGTSPQSSMTVAISVSNFPFGMSASAQVPANLNTITYNWRPTYDQIGVYVFSAGLSDSSGAEVSGGFHSFFLRVSAANCANGNELPTGGCNCTAGWTGDKCDTCKPDRYGSLCLPLPPCSHGTSNNGTFGDGKCICDPGWQGPACNVTVYKRCSPSDPNSILASSSLQSVVTPDFVQVSIVPNAAALQVPLVLTGKDLLTAEVFILLDTTTPAATATRYKSFVSDSANFKSYFNSKRENIRFSLGSFSDTIAAGQSNTFQLNSNFGTDIANALSSITLKTGSPSADIPYNVLLDAISKIGFSNTGTMKIIYLVTDNNLAPTDSALITKLAQALDNRNVLLGIFCLDSVSSYTPLLAASGSGYAVPWPATTTTPWFQLFVDNLYTPMTTNVVVKVKSDDYSFVSIPPPSPTTTTTWNTGIKMPATVPSALSPQVQINVVGYERQTIAVAINHVPTTSSTSLTLNEGTFGNFEVIANDIDMNILTIAFTTLPTKGTITIAGQPVTLNTQYSIPTSGSSLYTYTSTMYKNGADSAVFVVSDGCLTAQGSVSISVTAVDHPPYCSSATISTDQYTNKSLTLTYDSYDGTATTVSFTTVSSSLGSLYGSNGVALVANTAYNTRNFVFVPSRSAPSGTSTFAFVTRGAATSLTAQCSVGVTLARSNTPPTISGQSPITTIPDSTKAIPINIADIDDLEVLKLEVVSLVTQGGQFLGPTNQVLAAGTVIGNYDISATHSQDLTLSYTAPNAQLTGISITLKVTDKAGASVTKTIQVEVTGNRANTPPVATPVGPIVLDQDTLSPAFLLNGTDADQPRYDNVLGVVISSAPKFGSLQTPAGGLLSSLVTPLQVVYKPNQGYYGNDQLSFYVTDSLGATSPAIVVQFVVNRVNHAPLVSAPDVFSSGSSAPIVPTTFAIAASDVDVGDVLTVSVTLLPVTGQILQANAASTPITTVPTVVTNSSFFLQYLPSRTVFYTYVQPYSVRVCDNGTPSLCATATANIRFTYTNTAPTGKDVTAHGVQDTSLPFSLVGNDFEDGTKVNFKISQLPTSGKLYDNSNNLIATTSQLVTSPSLTYVPGAGKSDDDNSGRPLESLYYVVVDQNNTQSPNYQIQLYIKPVKPPIYKGEKNFTTLEDTPLPINLNAVSQYGNTFSIEITKWSKNGTLYFDTCGSVPSAACRTLITGANQTFGGPPFNLWYVPPADQNGDDFDQLSFVLVEEYRSVVYTIHINIEPVNDPPILVPISYTANGAVIKLSNGIAIPMNSTTLITYNATDIDSPYETITSTLQSLMKSGTLRSYTGQPTPTNASIVIGKNDTVPRSADGLWRVFYTPIPGRSGKGFEAISLNVIDDAPLSSMIYVIRVDVNPINLPPVVYIERPYWEMLATQQISVLGVSVDDPDSTTNSIKIVVSITPKTAIIEMPFSNTSTACTNTNSELVCIAPKATLNKFLQQIRVNVSEITNHTINVFVSDLGNLGGNELTDDKNVTVVVLPGPVDRPTSKTVLSAAIAGAAVGATLLSLGIWKLMKGRVPPTDAFFGDSPFTESNINSNPLYAESGNAGVNPLYESEANAI